MKTHSEINDLLKKGDWSSAYIMAKNDIDNSSGIRDMFMSRQFDQTGDTRFHIFTGSEPFVTEMNYLRVTLDVSSNWFFSFQEDCFYIPYYIECKDTAGDVWQYFADDRIDDSNYLGRPRYGLLKIKKESVDPETGIGEVSVGTGGSICGHDYDGKIVLSIIGLKVPESRTDIENNIVKLIETYKRLDIRAVEKIIKEKVYNEPIERILYCNAVDSLEDGYYYDFHSSSSNCLYMYIFDQKASVCKSETFYIYRAERHIVPETGRLILELYFHWMDDDESGEEIAISDIDLALNDLDLSTRPNKVCIDIDMEEEIRYGSRYIQMTLIEEWRRMSWLTIYFGDLANCV